MSRLAGRLLLAYNMYPIPMWTKPSCTLSTCRRVSKKSVKLQYIFPSWIVNRAIHVSLSTMSSASLDLQIDFPRVVSASSPAMIAAQNNAKERIKYLFSTGEASPMDIDERGTGLLFVRIKMERFPRKSLMTLKQLAIVVGAWDVAEFLANFRTDMPHCGMNEV